VNKILEKIAKSVQWHPPSKDIIKKSERKLIKVLEIAAWVKLNFKNCPIVKKNIEEDIESAEYYLDNLSKFIPDIHFNYGDPFSFEIKLGEKITKDAIFEKFKNHLEKEGALHFLPNISYSIIFNEKCKELFRQLNFDEINRNRCLVEANEFFESKEQMEKFLKSH